MASETKRRRWLPAPFSRRATIVWAVIVAVLLVAGAYFMYLRFLYDRPYPGLQS